MSQYPPPPPQPEFVSYRSSNLPYDRLTPAPRFRRARAWLMAAMALNVLLLPMLLVNALWIHPMTVDPVKPENAPLLLFAGFSMCGVGLAAMGIAVTGIVMFCMWIHRCNLAARQTGSEMMTYTPGWSVGWFFIPFAHLVMPALVMSELWKASDPELRGTSWRQARSTPLVGIWWTCWIIQTVASAAENAIDRVNEQTPTMAAGVMQTISGVFYVAAGIVLLMLMRQITERLERRLSNAAPAPAAVAYNNPYAQ